MSLEKFGIEVAKNKVVYYKCYTCKQVKPEYDFYPWYIKRSKMPRKEKLNETYDPYYCKKCKDDYERLKRSFYKAHPRPELGSPCEICGNTVKPLRMDHCRKEEKFRGFLCNPCNTTIGVMGDTLEKIDEYIEKVKRYLKKDG